MIPSAPVYSSTYFASSGVVMSPFATTGRRVDRLTSRIVSYSARPEKPQARVRPCRDKSCTPLSSAIFATFRAFLLTGSHPVRNFSVTGTFTAFTTALRMRATKGSSLRSADPARVLQTFFAGQPMLMSTICAPRSTLKRAASAIMAGSAPAICTEIGSTSPSWFARRSVFSLPHNSEFDATISDTARPAPKFLHSCLKGRSVTPAIGATNRLLRSACEPIRIDDHGKFFRAGAQFYTENRTIREALLPLRSKNSADAEIFSSRSAETAPRLLQGSARVPKIMRRARKRRAGGEERKGIREYPDQKVGESDSRVTVETAAADATLEKTRRADFLLGDIKQHLSQFPGIAQAEIESLACHRMQRLRGITHGESSGRGIDRAAAQ